MEQNKILEKKAREQLDSFLSECHIKDAAGKKILEIGFKNGLFLNECSKSGLVPTGIEINKEYHETVNAKFPHLNLVLYDGGNMPLPDESFDFVVSYQVFEHVNSIEQMLKECIRLLRPDGLMYHVCPNYGSFYEGHFKVIWLPFLNKSSGRFYLKLLRKYNNGYEGLNIIKSGKIRRILGACDDDIEIISLGHREFVNNFSTEQIKKVDQRLLRSMLKLIFKIKPVKKLVLGLICWANWHYPITIIARKK